MKTWYDLILNHTKKLDPRCQQSKADRSQLYAGFKIVHANKSEHAGQNRNNPEFGSALRALRETPHDLARKTWSTKQKSDWPQETMSKRSSWSRETCCRQRPKTKKILRSSALPHKGKVRPAGPTDDGGSPGACTSCTHLF